MPTALYEKRIESEQVKLFDTAERGRYRSEIYPLGRIPLLVLGDGHIIPEYLDANFDNGPRLILSEPDAGRRTRIHHRMLDLYLNDSIGSLLFQSWKP